MLNISNSPSGGAFHLDKAPTVTISESLACGWTAEFVEGSQQLVVRGTTATDNYTDTLEEGLTAAQEALDLVAMRGGPLLVLEGTDTQHIVWWKESRGRVLRITSVSDMGVSMSATATVRDANGNIVLPPPPPAVTWHPSFRYFRLSQTTEDLFDSYRNMYLALESALSSVVPQLTKPNGTINEGEGAWLRRALTEVNNVLSLARYAPAGSTDPVEDVFQDLYKGTRTGLFHAKSGRQILLPHEGGNRQSVIASLERLSRLYLDVAGRYLCAGRPSGAITYVGFDHMTSFDTNILVSEDDAPASKEDTAVNPKGGAKAVFSTRKAPELSIPGLKFWLGEEHAGNINTWPIRRVALAVANNVNPLTIDRLDEPLNNDGIDILQAQIGLRLVNLQQPRFRFNT